MPGLPSRVRSHSDQPWLRFVVAVLLSVSLVITLLWLSSLGSLRKLTHILTRCAERWTS